jgi:hypothetical protein
MQDIWKLLFISLGSVNLSYAYDPTNSTYNEYNSTGFLWPSFGPQFVSFYPQYSPILSLYVSPESVCGDLYHDYRTAYDTSSPLLLSICYDVENCLMDSLQSSVVSNYQSASVILGLMPSLLAQIGPSISEIAILSAHRPLLSFLLSMGAPAVNLPTRVFTYTSPSNVLTDDGTRLVLKSTNGKAQNFKKFIISMMEYILAAAAVVTVMVTSVEIGQRSILTWGCTTTILPFLWSTLAAAVHVVAALSYALVRWRKKPTPTSNARQRKSLGQRIRYAMMSELIPCADQDAEIRPDDAKAPRSAVLMNVVAGGFAFVHVIFGTIAMSSLQFISVSDVLNQILWRYLIPTAVCRLILIFEVAGLRGRLASTTETYEPVLKK